MSTETAALNSLWKYLLESVAPALSEPELLLLERMLQTEQTRLQVPNDRQKLAAIIDVLFPVFYLQPHQYETRLPGFTWEQGARIVSVMHTLNNDYEVVLESLARVSSGPISATLVIPKSWMTSAHGPEHAKRYCESLARIASRTAHEFGTDPAAGSTQRLVRAFAKNSLTHLSLDPDSPALTCEESDHLSEFMRSHLPPARGERARQVHENQLQASHEAPTAMGAAPEMLSWGEFGTRRSSFNPFDSDEAQRATWAAPDWGPTESAASHFHSAQGRHTLMTPLNGEACALRSQAAEQDRQLALSGHSPGLAKAAVGALRAAAAAGHAARSGQVDEPHAHQVPDAAIAPASPDMLPENEVIEANHNDCADLRDQWFTGIGDSIPRAKDPDEASNAASRADGEQRLLGAIAQALHVAYQHGTTDGAHHKMWVIDQMVRALLTGEFEYQEWVRAYCSGTDGPNTYEWNEGSAP